MNAPSLVVVGVMMLVFFMCFVVFCLC